MTKQTRSYTITASPHILARFDRLLAMFHWNSRHGHSGVFGMPLDGDGGDGITVSPEPDHKQGVSRISDVGYDVELARDSGFGGSFNDNKRKCRWWVDADGTRHRDD